IAMKAMARDRSDRYQEAEQFAEAVQRYLRHSDAEQQCRRAAQQLDEERKELPRRRHAGERLHPVTLRLIEIADRFRQAGTHWGSDALEEEGHRQAVEGEAETRIELAGLALETGDFALADAQLDLAEKLVGEAATQVAALRARVRQAAAARR